MGKIALEGMVFYAHHGYYDDEQERGNKFIVDLSFESNTEQAALSDDLNHTVNYEAVYEVIKTEMGVRSKLLEHVGKRVVNNLKNAFPSISEIELKLSKINPPLKGMVESVSVTLKG